MFRVEKVGWEFVIFRIPGPGRGGRRAGLDPFAGNPLKKVFAGTLSKDLLRIPEPAEL